MTGLSITLLGSLTAILDGQPVNSYGYNKVRALLAYLVIESGGPHRRESIAGLLWPDQSERAALDSLRNALAKLRQVIGDREADPPYLLITTDTIQFNPASLHTLDYSQFTDLLTACQTHRHRRLESCSSCLDWLTQAVSLYHGEFLEGLSIPDSDLFEDWAALKREKLSQMVQEALHSLTSIYEWQGKYDQALIYTRRSLELDPCREEAHFQAIKLLALNGMHAEACAQYQKCRESLQKELDVLPAEETTHLYEQIKNGLFQSSPIKKRTSTLPSTMTSFIGRECELAEINALIEDPNCRLLSMVGPGGVGKTRLALAAANHQLNNFPDGAFFVSLAGVDSIEFIIPAIVDALGIKLAEQDDSLKQLASYLHGKEMLLVLDNFEQLIEGTGLISDLLRLAPGLMIVITSRQRLGLQAEWLFEVNGLSYPHEKALHNPESYDAVQLFIHRLQQVRSAFQLDENNLACIFRICQIVEGLPLGIELAASSVRVKSLNQILSAIESGKDDLAIFYKDVPARHRNLRAVFENSYNILTAEEKVVFCGLSVFRGGFTAEASQKITEASPLILANLVDQSLIRFDTQKERYDLHELVRQYALEKLITQGRETVIRKRHLDYFTDLAEQFNSIFIQTYQWDHYMKLTPDADNFRTGLEWAFSNGELEVALQLAGALGNFWERMDRWQEGERWLERILDSDHPFVHDQYLARALTRAAWLVRFRDMKACKIYAEKGLSIYEEINTPFGIADAKYILGIEASVRGDGELSRKLLAESLQIFRQLGEQARMADVMNELAQKHFRSSLEYNIKASLDFLYPALEISREVKHYRIAAEILNSIGMLEMGDGKFIHARMLFEEGIALLKDQPYEYKITFIIDSLGMACFYLGDYPAANYYYEWGLEVSRNFGMKNFATLSNLSYMCSFLGDHERAYKILKEVFRQLDHGYFFFCALADGVLNQIPGVLVRGGEARRAALLYGFMMGQFETFCGGCFPLFIYPNYEADVAEARHQLGDTDFTAAWDEGHNMTFEQAKACALGAQIKIIPSSVTENTVDPSGLT